MKNKTKRLGPAGPQDMGHVMRQGHGRFSFLFLNDANGRTRTMFRHVLGEMIWILASDPFHSCNCSSNSHFQFSLAYCSVKNRIWIVTDSSVRVINTTTTTNKTWKKQKFPDSLTFLSIRSSFNWCVWPGLGENFISVVTLAGENGFKCQST